MESLINHLRQYSRLSSEAEAALTDSFNQLTLSRNEYLLTEGRICRHLYFLETGALRGYYTLEDKEITHWFGFENDFVTSFHSFITGEPSVENLQLLEGSVLWSISKDTLTTLLGRFHEIERLLRIAYEKYYIRLEERFVNAQFKTAAERYDQLLSQTPHILERVPLGQVASYLGISQETLSRIRSRF
ncbi:Crp/Fnr family transcriptional regulator [Terrimonas sp. NA20]|uniref:Crp/Fnr family transcriptional regulator n=1 Tax=Terrimonas ginsenosidimutans TaxID=2908004 RepID=A0ABS9KNZ5_9BACT|nr:Crp/Fnr family transcriptional regulator [Terrimonas ginsenosidimutans]MCG2614047.1 Crp/Fnr family transcriptional regulator [Terrimonas ginsenosidimutans]